MKNRGVGLFSLSLWLAIPLLFAGCKTAPHRELQPVSPAAETQTVLKTSQTNTTPANDDCGISAFPVSLSAKEMIAAVPPSEPSQNSGMFARIQINPEGKITHLRVLRLAYPKLPNSTAMNEQAVNNIKHWSYAPTKFDGKPVFVCSDVTVTIDLLAQ